MNNCSKRNVLSSDEWDFRGISKPEIWICWNYEFAREAVRMDSRLLRPTTEWRAGAPESFQERLKYLRQHPFISIGGWLGLLSPEWPDRSYLFLESDERISRIEHVTVGEGSDQVSTVILQLDWSRGRTEILRAFGDLLSKMEAQDMKAQDPRGAEPN
jgi:hypothetical protein